MSKNLGKVIAGVGIGVGLGLLFAPEKGEVTRKKLKNKGFLGVFGLISEVQDESDTQ